MPLDKHNEHVSTNHQPARENQEEGHTSLSCDQVSHGLELWEIFTSLKQPLHDTKDAHLYTLRKTKLKDWMQCTLQHDI